MSIYPWSARSNNGRCHFSGQSAKKRKATEPNGLDVYDVQTLASMKAPGVPPSLPRTLDILPDLVGYSYSSGLVRDMCGSCVIFFCAEWSDQFSQVCHRWAPDHNLIINPSCGLLGSSSFERSSFYDKKCRGRISSYYICLRCTKY